ncbi:MAG: RNA-binding S4 domain-containing protein [Clostridia bacterium]
MRLDKFLKVSRILKRRTVANEVCKSGKVEVNNRQIKPSFELKEGDIVSISYANGKFVFKVLMLKDTVRKEEADKMYEVVCE